MTDSSSAAQFREAVAGRTARLGVVGLGYVGLPLAVEMAEAGYSVLGFEVSRAVVERVNAGDSHIQDVASDRLAALVQAGRIEATLDLGRLAECDAISICVPTPLGKTKDPDLSYVVSATLAIRETLRPGQLVILESTTYPGTTREAMLPVLEEAGLTVGEDFFLCFSPERVDPGNAVWHTKNTPKVLGGLTPTCTALGEALYGEIFDTIVPVSSAESAELVKLYENTFRMINIALANEMAQVCERLDVDVWEVIDAAATKPFGFMKFTPGPGLGGHCIPLDPHYLSWKMRTLAFKTRMIELSSEINAEMPAFVVRKVADALNEEGKAVKGSRLLVLGIAYKKDIDDLRESPALEVIQLLQAKGAEVSYHDPFCPTIADDGHTLLTQLPMHSQPLTDARLAEADAVVVVTDHSAVDYRQVRAHARLVVDTRGVMRAVPGAAKVVGLSGQEHASAGSASGPSTGSGTGPSTGSATGPSASSGYHSGTGPSTGSGTGPSALLRGSSGIATGSDMRVAEPGTAERSRSVEATLVEATVPSTLRRGSPSTGPSASLRMNSGTAPSTGPSASPSASLRMNSGYHSGTVPSASLRGTSGTGASGGDAEPAESRTGA